MLGWPFSAKCWSATICSRPFESRLREYFISYRIYIFSLVQALKLLLFLTFVHVQQPKGGARTTHPQHIRDVGQGDHPTFQPHAPQQKGVNFFCCIFELFICLLFHSNKLFFFVVVVVVGGDVE
jgi:hypothetical protein